MQFEHWLSLFALCLMGAMSPGPSLAVVMRAALRGNRRSAYGTAVAHGLGVGLYALLTVTGLAVLITRWPGAFLSVQLLGAAFLVYLGVQALREGLEKHAGLIDRIFGVLLLVLAISVILRALL